jgi:CheY-like chemotaxis protein
MGDGIGRVVVVDDDEDLRDLVVHFLEESGYDAVGFADGREALAVLRRRDGRPTVVLLDLEMPAMTGWEFRRQQLADPRLAPIPVVVASAADPGTIDADAYLAKPYGPVELRRTLEGLCARAGAGRAARPAG